MLKLLSVPGFNNVVVSCEHASNRVPARYAGLFGSDAGVLEGHRGYDPGAFDVARFLARNLGAPIFSGGVSRLLVDLNRSLGHPALFSEYVRDLDPAEKAKILASRYYPYRRQVEEALRREIAESRRVLHLAIHSFAPEMDGKVRRADIGLLYDPGRAIERDVCARILDRLRRADPALALRRNYPYRGTSDGFTTHLRRVFGAGRYAGVEIELNQARLAGNQERRRIAAILAGAVGEELATIPSPR